MRKPAISWTATAAAALMTLAAAAGIDRLAAPVAEPMPLVRLAPVVVYGSRSAALELAAAQTLPQPGIPL